MKRLHLPFFILMLGAIGQAHALSFLGQAEGNYQYLFDGATSLRIKSSGDLDLSGLRLLSLRNDGIFVSAAFELQPLPAVGQAQHGDGLLWQTNISNPGSFAAYAGGALSLYGRLSGFNEVVLSGLERSSDSPSSVHLFGRIDLAPRTLPDGVAQAESLTTSTPGDIALGAGSLIRTEGSLVYPLPSGRLQISQPGPITLADGRVALLAGTVTLVPEPSALWMLLAGGTLLGLRLRQRYC